MKLFMKLDGLGDVLQRVLNGASAGSLETEVLDFKRDPHTITGPDPPGDPQARLIEELVDAVVCFANARGGRIVLGVDDKATGETAFSGTYVDSAMLRSRIYGNTRPQLTVPIEEVVFADARLLVITVPGGTRPGHGRQRQGGSPRGDELQAAHRGCTTRNRARA